MLVATACLLLALPLAASAQETNSQGSEVACRTAAETIAEMADALPAASASGANQGETTDIDDPGALASLGQRLLQETRETADYGLLERAEEAFSRLREIDPVDVEAILGLGSIALARHEFDAALTLGRQALEVAPSSSRALGIAVDAQVELGRYEEAGDVLESMLRTRPDLSSYSRLSYYHELHGRHDLAIEAMERAVIAAGPVPENTEYVRVLLGDLWLKGGNVPRARCLYQVSLDRLPGYVLALRGLAETAAAEGDLDSAVTLLEQAVARTPLPEFLILLAEMQEAANGPEAAQDGYRLVSDIEALLRSQGVVTDPGLAVFEVDHGDPAVALAQAREIYALTPSVRAADALAWALHANGFVEEAQSMIDEALGLGWQDPAALYHAGVIALSRGDSVAARELLGQSLDRNPGAWPLLQQHTLAALERAADQSAS